ncbi:hypothetical protein AcV5_009614 [Taiwanofungus camphoratus]|nr:hypothetical protein AcV5_009614 [Antrodia cinnamomea]KAI0942947.1 hypothetical protein AcV7_002228 [Antrodia cinnamomea]
MSKLKKPIHPVSLDRGRPSSVSQNAMSLSIQQPTQSRTMMYARTVLSSSTTIKTSTVDTALPAPSSMRPVSSAEHYWAARALTAEALLSVRAAHNRDLRALQTEEEERRFRELTTLQRAHHERHANLEKLMALLLICFATFTFMVVYGLSRHHHRASSSRWLLPSHFTIPILSPFSSVVEHETSVINPKLVLLLVFAGLGYACFRYWLTHGARR